MCARCPPRPQATCDLRRPRRGPPAGLESPRRLHRLRHRGRPATAHLGSLVELTLRLRAASGAPPPSAPLRGPQQVWQSSPHADARIGSNPSADQRSSFTRPPSASAVGARTTHADPVAPATSSDSSSPISRPPSAASSARSATTARGPDSASRCAGGARRPARACRERAGKAPRVRRWTGTASEEKASTAMRSSARRAAPA